MSNIIQDGTGASYGAKVDSNNRLYTQSITEAMSSHAGELGRKFNINTGDITLTSSAETTVLYVKNNETYDYIVENLIYNLGNTTGGSGDIKLDLIRNPTAGAIVSNANAVDINSNQNFGSTITFSSLAYKGATGEAVFSDGTVSVSTRSASSTGRIFISLGAIVIPRGVALGINYTPPTGNTSQICQFAIAGFVQTLEV